MVLQPASRACENFQWPGDVENLRIRVGEHHDAMRLAALGRGAGSIPSGHVRSIPRGTMSKRSTPLHFRPSRQSPAWPGGPARQSARLTYRVDQLARIEDSAVLDDAIRVTQVADVGERVCVQDH